MAVLPHAAGIVIPWLSLDMLMMDFARTPPFELPKSYCNCVK